MHAAREQRNLAECTAGFLGMDDVLSRSLAPDNPHTALKDDIPTTGRTSGKEQYGVAFETDLNCARGERPDRNTRQICELFEHRERVDRDHVGRAADFIAEQHLPT